jgi:hypothetical protein
MFSFLLFAIFSVCVLGLDEIFYFLCWSSLLDEWKAQFENSK